MPDLPAVAALAAMERAELIALWTALLRQPVPPRLGVTFLRHVLAWELQLRQRGGLSAVHRRRLQSLSEGRARPQVKAIAPGGRLLREWNGTTHVVEITASGYSWQGRSYRSLSAIAKAITGAHWSGPRFFGLGATRPGKVPRNTAALTAGTRRTASTAQASVP